MKRFAKILQILAPVVLIIIAEVILFKANYVPGTWLIGWDSTQPELNFKAHLLRDINAVWQEYRGLGVLDGMAHAANIVHLFYVWLLSLFLAPNVIRYVFVVLMHAIGGLGIYFLLRYLLRNKSKAVKTTASLAASFFYLFNPGTIQMFYVPFEVFIIHFGFLPWLLLVLVRYLDSGKKKDLAAFVVFNILAISQSHVPTIFIVYALSVFVFLLFYLLRGFRNIWRRVLTVVLLLFAINSFWGLPYIYSSFKNAQTITASKINTLSNYEIVLRNEAFGDLKSVSLLHGFNLDYEDWQEGEEFDYQFKDWRDFWLKSEVERIGFVFFGLSILGMVIAIARRKKEIYPFIVLFLIAFINLGSGIPVVSFVRKLIWTYVPYYEEVFRFFFTKFIILYALSLAVLLGFALERIFSLKKIKFLSIVFSAGLIGAVVWTNLPVFEGEFLYHKLRIEVPSEYFRVFEFFNKPTNEGRVAILPQPSLWGWEFNQWGYRGSGFIWQGIDNPTLHRSFDPWSSYNEGYYHELSQAVYAKDLRAFEGVLEKYQVSWIVLDGYIFQPGGWPQALFFEEIKDLLEDSEHIKKAQEFGEMAVYRTDLTTGSKKYIWAPESFVEIGNELDYSRRDLLYLQEGDYIAGEGLYYPFIRLLGDRPIEEIFSSEGIRLSTEVEGGGKYQLVLPAWLEKENYVPVDIYADYSGGREVGFRFLGLYPQILIDKVNQTQPFEEEFSLDLGASGIENLLVSLGGETFFVLKSEENEQYLGSFLLLYGEPTSLRVYNAEPETALDLVSGFAAQEVRECWRREGATPVVDKTSTDEGIKLSSIDAAACVGINISVNIKKPDGLMKFSLKHKSTTETPPDTCLVKVGDAGCIGQPASYRFGPSLDWSPLEEYYEVETGAKYFFDLTARGNDLPGAESVVEYGDIRMGFYPLLGKVQVSVDQSFTPERKTVSLDSLEKILVEIPLGLDKGLVYSEKWENNRGRDSAKNCDLFARGTVEKKADPEGVAYKAENKGANCCYMIYPDFRKGIGYLLRFVGENKSGRSIKFFLNNHFTRRNDLEHTLGRGSFDEGYVILPSQDENGKYDLSLETRSFGKEISENYLDELQIMPIPLNWLTSIKLIPEEEDISISNDLQILKVTKLGVSNYSVSVDAKAPKTLLVLSQAFEDGWQAYKLGNVFGEKLEHTKVNSWANGWLVPEGEHSIVIVYWPQYLEYLGFFLVFVSLVWLTGKLIRPSSKSRAILE